MSENHSCPYVGPHTSQKQFMESELVNGIQASYTIFFIPVAPSGAQGICETLRFNSVSKSYRQSVGLLGRGISSSQGLYLNTGQHKHRINTYTHRTSMPCVGFEPMIPASERAKTARLL
jgi:hypothetical protein